VIFAHGSGSSRHSPRNRAVACKLNAAGFATLLADLLTHEEMAERDNVFDVEMLAGRLAGATSWARSLPELAGLPVGYFGASTGAAATLIAAAEAPEAIDAIVCRGGRPDLAGERIRAVTSPTLMIVGGVDLHVLELNEIAASRMAAPHRVAVVPGANHLFEQPGALERVAELASDWFDEHLAADGETALEEEFSAR
jgi:putative phosphoribosyl transferase